MAFAARYFPSRYFARRYWPAVGAAAAPGGGGTVTVYISYIGAFGGSVQTSSLYNETQVTWIREADMSTFAVRANDTEIVPDDATYAAETAASIAGITAALNNQSITTGDTRWIMYDLESYPPTQFLTDEGDEGNGVDWSQNYDTDLNAAAYKAKTQPAFEALFDACDSHATGASFGLHLIPNRLTYAYGRVAGNDDEADTPWAGAIADMAWLGTKLVAKGGRLFCWLYVINNIGDSDGSGTATEEEVTNLVTNSVSYYRAAATSLGLDPDTNVYYTWHYAVGNVNRPTQETLEVYYAALQATGYTIHWVAAMGSATTLAALTTTNVYLNTVVIPALGGSSEGGSTTVATGRVRPFRYRTLVRWT